MWINWTIQSGQSLTSRPERTFARMKATTYAEPKGRRIIGHNESEGMKLRNRKQLYRAKVSTSLKPESLHALADARTGLPAYRAFWTSTLYMNSCLILKKSKNTSDALIGLRRIERVKMNNHKKRGGEPSLGFWILCWPWMVFTALDPPTTQRPKQQCL